MTLKSIGHNNKIGNLLKQQRKKKLELDTTKYSIYGKLKDSWHKYDFLFYSEPKYDNFFTSHHA